MANLGTSRFQISWYSRPFAEALLFLLLPVVYWRLAVLAASRVGWWPPSKIGLSTPIPPALWIAAAALTAVWAVGRLLRLATTTVGPEGIRYRTLFGRRSLGWPEVRGYSESVGRRTSSYWRLSGPGKVVVVCPEAFTDPGGVRAYLHQHLAKTQAL